MDDPATNAAMADLMHRILREQGRDYLAIVNRQMLELEREAGVDCVLDIQYDPSTCRLIIKEVGDRQPR